MRSCKRNWRPFWYCLYDYSEDQYDEYGNLLPEPLKVYKEPVLMYANISAATGQAQTEQFGNLDTYDRVIATTDMSCPIDEHTVLFIEKEPDYPWPEPDDDEEDDSNGSENDNNQTNDGNNDTSEDDEDEEVWQPKYDYIVKRVARSLNSISIAVRKVDVG